MNPKGMLSEKSQTSHDNSWLHDFTLQLRVLKKTNSVEIEQSGRRQGFGAFLLKEQAQFQ